MKRFTEAEDQIILSGLTAKEAAEKTGRKIAAINSRRYLLKKNGVKAKRKYTKKNISVVNERLSATGAMMNFKVNGTELSIEKGVKQVIVGKNSIEINL